MTKHALVLVFVLVCGFVVMTTSPQSVQAASCSRLSAYTDYFQGKPALIVYYPGGKYPDSQDQSRIHAYFWNTDRGLWEYVPKNNNGIRFDALKHHSGGWAYYHIATRWALFNGEHRSWNEDRFWYVMYCS